MRGLGTVLIAAACLGACTPRTPSSQAIEQSFAASGRRSVDLDQAVPGAWTRVCILGPYSDNAATRATLGFAWDSQVVSTIATDDSIVLLVFVGAGDRVLHYTEHPRRHGDFSNLSRQCFSRGQARFGHVQHPTSGWPGLFQASAGPLP